MIQNLKKSKAGFTLVELIVVIAILGVLAAVLVPQYIQYVDKSKTTADTATVNEVAHAMQTAVAGEATLVGKQFTVVVSTTGMTLYSGSGTTTPITSAGTDKTFSDAFLKIVPAATLNSGSAQIVLNTDGTTSIT